MDHSFFDLLRSGTLDVQIKSNMPGLHEMADRIERLFAKDYSHIFWNMKSRTKCDDDPHYLAAAIKRIKKASSVQGLRLLASCIDEWEKNFS